MQQIRYAEILYYVFQKQKEEKIKQQKLKKEQQKELHNWNIESKYIP